MANNAENIINYYLRLPLSCRAELAHIRSWANLKTGVDGQMFWVKGFTEEQINDVKVKIIPEKVLFYEKDNKLFLLNSLLPEISIPGILWSPIENGLPITLPQFNHNYFGVNEQIEITLNPSEKEETAVLQKVAISHLVQYINIAPAIRLAPLKWCLFGDSEALVMGTPLLPLPGNTYWLNAGFILPSGYDLTYPFLQNHIEVYLNTLNHNYVLWDVEGNYSLIDKSVFIPLTRSSLRQTLV